jgi:hypothetical protein
MYSLGIFNGAPDNASGDTDVNHAKDVAGRVFLQPFNLRGPSRFGLLGFGMAGSVGDQLSTPAAPNLPTFRTAGQNQFFGYLASAMDPTATVYAAGQRSRGNPQFYYYVGPLGLLADYVASRESVRAGTRAEILDPPRAGTPTRLGGAGAEKTLVDGVTPTAPLESREKGILGPRWSWRRASPSWTVDSGPFAPLFPPDHPTAPPPGPPPAPWR